MQTGHRKASKQTDLDVICIDLIGRICRSQYGSRDKDIIAIHSLWMTLSAPWVPKFSRKALFFSKKRHLTVSFAISSYRFSCFPSSSLNRSLSFSTSIAKPANTSSSTRSINREVFRDSSVPVAIRLIFSNFACFTYRST